MAPLRIALAGFSHETNTFATWPTTLDDFIANFGEPGWVFADAAGFGGVDPLKMLHQLGRLDRQRHAEILW